MSAPEDEAAGAVRVAQHEHRLSESVAQLADSQSFQRRGRYAMRIPMRHVASDTNINAPFDEQKVAGGKPSTPANERKPSAQMEVKRRS